LVFHYKISSILCPSNEEEKGYMFHVWYASRKFDECVRWSVISYAVGVVSGYMENPSETVKWVLQYFRSTNITYKGDEWTRA
jgi:hypothetical protein